MTEFKLSIKEIPDNIKSILSDDEINKVISKCKVLNEIAYDLIEIEEYENALEIFNYSYSLNGFSPDLLNGLAVTYSEMGQRKNALRIMERASEKYPKDAVTLANTATLFWEENNYAKAIYFYMRAIDENKTLLDAYINMINLHYECGDIFLAFITCLNVLEVFPEDDQILELRDELIFDMAISFS